MKLPDTEELVNTHCESGIPTRSYDNPEGADSKTIGGNLKAVKSVAAVIKTMKQLESSE